MDPFFAVAAEKLILLNKAIVPESNGRFLGFEPTYNSEDSKNGLNSVVSFGRVVYTVHDVVKKSPNLFIKTIPRCPFLPEFAGFNFTNENHFYTQVLPFMAGNTDPLGTSNLFAKFYSCFMNATAPIVVSQSSQHCLMEGIMVLEDLRSQGYVPSPKLSFLDYDHLSLMMRKLGQFHAYSYALKSRGDLSRKFHSLVRAFTDISFMNLGEYQGLLPATCLWTLDCMLGAEGDLEGREFLAQNGHSLEELRRYFQNVEDECRQLFSRNDDPEMAILCHCDLTVANAMFKYGEDGAPGKPVDMKIIDMANCKLTSPAVDISTVLYMHTDQRTRDLYWDSLMDVYMNSMQETLATCSPRMNVVVPSREDIEGQMRKYTRRGFFIATFYLGVLIARDRRLPVDQFTPKATWDTLDITQWDSQQHIEFSTQVGGEWATLALADVLKDAIKRGYI